MKGKGNGTGDGDESTGAVGLRVVSASLKEDPDGGQKAVIKVAGIAKGLTNLVGEAVRVEALDGGHFLGHCRQVTITEGKDGKPRTVSAKVAGGPDLADLVARGVRLTKAQGNLFRSEDAAGAEA